MKSNIVSNIKKGAVVVGLGVASSSAMADTSAAITSAISAAEANMTVVTVGVLTVAAIGFGIGLVTSFLRR
ncbi:hypothetical protein [Photobacterium sanguinicancri]|uniref:Major coat protein n=1 Tax=Photobacterium sanguinicancri TaxID=875932 RepID=A0AAW7Y4Y1_9GAMM|nr:hypothetical protein [Photobacterium sanguinicancri]MDO6543477.1 hypothetical protein [Photobacterium sanguinicancri]